MSDPDDKTSSTGESSQQYLAVQASVASLQAVVQALAEMKATLLEAKRAVHRVEVETRPAEEILETAAAVLQEAETGVSLIITRATVMMRATQIQTTRGEGEEITE